MNQYRLARVRKGMGQKQVLQVMHKPYKYETFEIEEDVYDVWFYVTRTTVLDQSRMVPQNLTPLTFKNGILVGTGYTYYYYLVKAEAHELNPNELPDKPKIEKNKSTQEDKEFEKTLRNTSTKPSEETPEEKEESTQKEKEKLPPNIHIISKTKLLFVPEKDTAEENSSFQVEKALPEEDFEQEIPFLSEQEEKGELAAEYSSRAMQQRLSTIKPYQYKGALIGVIPKQAFTSLRKGMTEAQVVDVLGVTADQEQFALKENTYTVWIYQLEPTRLSSHPKKVFLTFKNGLLVSKNRYYYQTMKSRASQAPEKEILPRSSEKMQQIESDQNFNFW